MFGIIDKLMEKAEHTGAAARLISRAMELEKPVTGILAALTPENLPIFIARWQEETDPTKRARLAAAYLLHQYNTGELVKTLAKTHEGVAVLDLLRFGGLNHA